MKKIFSFILFLSTALFATAQARKTYDDTRWVNIITNPVPENIHLSAQLYQIALLAETDLAEANDRLLHSALRVRREDSTVNVEIVYRNDENAKDIKDKIDPKYLINAGFTIDQTWKNRASIWVKLDHLLRDVKKLSKDYYTFLVTKPPADDDAGPIAANSLGYKTSGGPAGGGKRVAVFDYGFAGLQTVINAGFAKAPAFVSLNGTTSNVAGVNIGGQEHGTSCVETIYDHAPDADYELYVVDNATERGNAVTSCIAHGVNVISMAVSEYNTGWADDSGPACAYANAAANGGLIFVTSAGNRATSHYEATFKDIVTPTNNRHEFSGTDEKNKLVDVVANGGSANSYLSWEIANNWDLDIAICRVSNDAVLANSATVGSTVSAYEFVSWTNNTGAAVSVYFRVTRRGGTVASPVKFEMFNTCGVDYQYMSIAGSTTSPSNSTSPNVVSVGAVVHDYFTEPSGTDDLIAGYSSQGPTNNNNLAPKITGPTNTTTTIYSGGIFSGTSCATANTAGALTAFWSANPYLDNTGVTQIVYRTSELYRDWGTAGDDYIYGHGGLRLYGWEPNLRYMFRTPANAAITNATRPYYKLSVAEANAPNGAKVVMLNSGGYTENGVYGGPPGNGSGKSILYVSPFTFPGNFGF